MLAEPLRPAPRTDCPSIGTHLSTTTMGLSLPVKTIRPRQSISALMAIIARFSTWKASCDARRVAHSRQLPVEAALVCGAGGARGVARRRRRATCGRAYLPGLAQQPAQRLQLPLDIVHRQLSPERARPLGPAVARCGGPAGCGCSSWRRSARGSAEARTRAARSCPAGHRAPIDLWEEARRCLSIRHAGTTAGSMIHAARGLVSRRLVQAIPSAARALATVGVQRRRKRPKQPQPAGDEAADSAPAGLVADSAEGAAAAARHSDDEPREPRSLGLSPARVLVTNLPIDADEAALEGMCRRALTEAGRDQDDVVGVRVLRLRGHSAQTG